MPQAVGLSTLPEATFATKGRPGPIRVTGPPLPRPRPPRPERRRRDRPDINTAQTVPDNIGMLYRKHLSMFGPREVLLTSEEPVVSQFLNGRRQGPIGMSEEKDTAQALREMAEAGEPAGLPEMKPQLEVSPGMPERKAVARRRERVMQVLPTLSPAAQEAIRRSYANEPVPAMAGGGAPPQPSRGLLGGPGPSADTAVLPPSDDPPTWFTGPGRYRPPR